VDLNGARTDPQVYRDIPIVLAEHYPLHDFLLSRRQVREQASGLILIALDEERYLLARERLGQRSQQLLVVKGFLEKIDGKGTESFPGRGDVTVPSHDDDRQVATQLRQALLQREPVHAGHPDIEQDAASPILPEGLQEGRSIGKDGNPVIVDPQEQAQRVTDGGIVVHDEYGQMISHGYPEPESAEQS
jgi:hypothetical protein